MTKNNQYIKFQEGTVKDEGVNGIQVDEAIQALIDRVKYLDSQFHSEYNDQTLSSLEAALDAQNKRNADRKSRGVEGTYKR